MMVSRIVTFLQSLLWVACLVTSATRVPPSAAGSHRSESCTSMRHGPVTAALEAVGPACARDLGRHGSSSRYLHALTARHRAGPQERGTPERAHQGHKVPIGDVDAEPLRQPLRPHADVPGPDTAR